MDGKKLELKPCPFCGGEAEFETKGDISNYTEVGFDFTIKCGECGIEIPGRHKVTFILGKRGKIITIIDEREMAMNDWNRRHE